MLITIIIPSFNYGKFIAHTLGNVTLQTYSNIEVLVVDDGSVDNTKEIVLNLAEKDKRIKYIYQNNKGLSAARNTGLRHSKGQFIQFLDADDLLSERKLEIQLQHFLRDHTLDISYTNAVYFSNEDPKTFYKTLELTNRDWMPKLVGDKFSTWKALIDYNIMPVNAALVKRSIIDKTGFFNEELRSLEDWEYWLRCSVVGKVTFVDNVEAFAMIRVHDNSMSQNKARMLSLEIDLRGYIQDLINSLPLNRKDSKKLLAQNAKKIKNLLAREISNLGLFDFASFGGLVKKIGFKNFLRGYFKAINEYRKKSSLKNVTLL
ncbi:MAG: glycosyltransferase [Pedobacter sp.]|uniref:glycosyltransferase family 2 protein n=1 Tax=Pedobacter sp. TaxID=1411316 RepID=UPI00280A0C6F|nr:glycosyltransferase [Pedobacter sp.]MDQ8004974.1 glycosyltransferase [Pedobacter sp.]